MVFSGIRSVSRRVGGQCLLLSVAALCVHMTIEPLWAGCHYRSGNSPRLTEQEAAILVLTADGWIKRRGDVTRVYDGGRFYYFSRVGAAPCDGPQCDQRQRREALAPIVVTPPERHVPVAKGCCPPELLTAIGKLVAKVDLNYFAVFASDIFHPPRNA